MSKSLIWKLLLAAPLVLLTHPASADVKTGVEAWSRGNYQAAMREWQVPADKGDADALFNLGQAHKLGRGVKPDLRKAEELFGRAAEKGHLQASDIYGLLLFQRGERERALPYVRAAAERGEPRAQYLLGVAHFNGDGVDKDWVRAYALASLARQAGVEQARAALAQMDRYIPLEQRQRGAALAPELASRAEVARARQMAAVDLGSIVEAAPMAASGAPAISAAARPRVIVSPNPKPSPAARNDSPRAAGADFTRTQPRPSPAPRLQPTSPARVAVPAPQPTPRAATSSGRWAVQLGAFSVASNADALWNRIKGRPELAGRSRQLVRAGAVTRLLAGGFPSRDVALQACARLSGAGISCVVPRN